jgi:hypothetical protein
MQTNRRWRQGWCLAESAFGGSLESGGWCYVGVGSHREHDFTFNSLYKYIYKFCTFSAIW